ncbi:hypothetical protein C2E20_1128 [Micractinium conductrix]|uniref:Uncharacterized protein n=1 Tax=Micractinium conductrix TaxID=554055 RepID=A0A2P6VMC7_9CHLO|nr:hypothetical protein C2E20_1128 [Micractinium conductrix]|eukprot:PSC75248.1 hypothetical protein C2E20_1128 [Micractinium conductrix]
MASRGPSAIQALLLALLAGAALATSDIEVESAEEARALAAQLVEAGGDAPYRVTYRTKKVSAESDGQGWQKTVTTIVTTEISNQQAARSAAAANDGGECPCACPCSPPPSVVCEPPPPAPPPSPPLYRNATAPPFPPIPRPTPPSPESEASPPPAGPPPRFSRTVAPRPVPPPVKGSIVGDPYVHGFQGQFWMWKGVGEREYKLLVVGDGSRMDGTLGWGGLKGKQTFLRDITFKRGDSRTKTELVKVGEKAWAMRVYADGKMIESPYETAELADGTTVEPFDVNTDNSFPQAVRINTPYLRIEAIQRFPSRPAQINAPDYGNWLDVFVYVKRALPEPVKGILGATYAPPPEGAVGAASTPMASIQFDYSAEEEEKRK